MLKGLFVPEDDYFSGQFEQIREDLRNRLSVESFDGIMDSVKTAVAGDMPNVEITIMGFTATIINFDYWRSVKPAINGFIRGFVFILLCLYNYNQIYKLVRGTSLVDFSGGAKS